MGERLAQDAEEPMPEKRMKTTRNRWIGKARRFITHPLAATAAASLAVALGLSACENVQGYTSPSLIRIIDASYIAGAVNVWVEGELVAGNIAAPYVAANYATLPASGNAVVVVTAASATGPILTNALVTSHVTALAGQKHSVFLTDNGSSPVSYNVTVIQDQQITAPEAHSEFRFINEAPRTGANGVDVYMVPSGSTLGDANLLLTVPLGQTVGYTIVPAEALTMIVAPSGQTTIYSSTPLSLAGGEVRTVLITDSQLTNKPPLVLVIADDVN